MSPPLPPTRRWPLPWLRPSLAPLVLLLACIPTSQVPAVAPSRTLDLAGGVDASAPEPFGAVFTGPTGAVDAHAQLNLVFNRPLRALGPAATESLPPIGMTPAIEGRWRWLGTSALIFEPAQGRLPLATRIELVVPRGVRALDGSELPEPVQVGLETPRPELVGSSPYEGSHGLGPGQSFELRFNQEIDPRELERAARLVARTDSSQHEVAYSVSLPDPKAPRRLRLTPRRPLPPAHTVELVIDAGLRGTEGPLPSARAQRLSFETYGPLEVRNVHCAHGPSEELCAPGHYVALELSNPVRLRDAKAALTIEPAVPLTWSAWQSDDDHVSYLELDAPFQAGTKYVVRLRAGLEDIHGQRLQQTIARTLRIDDYWPRLEVGIEGDSFEPTARADVPVVSVNVPQYTLLTAPLSPAQVASYLPKRGKKDAFDWLLGQAGVRSRNVTTGAALNRVSTELVEPKALLRAQGGRGALVIATRSVREGRPELSSRLLQVTDLAITAKLGRRSSLVWVTQLSSARPVAGAEVTILREGTAPSSPVLTDAQGMATLPAAALADALGDAPDEGGAGALVIARHGADWAFREVSDYIAPWRMQVPTDVFGKPQSYGFLFTERGIYRPGDEVELKGIVRREAKTGNEVLAGKKLTLVLRSPSWDIAQQWSVTTNAFGTFARTIKLPRAAALGSWHIHVKEFEGERGASTTLEVAEYRPTELAAQVSSAQPSYVQGSAGSFAVQGDYLYGAPMSGAKLTYHASRSETFFRVPGTDGFRTDAALYDSAYPDKAPSAGTLVHGEATLDAQGKYVRPVPLDLPGQRGPELVSFDAEIMDVSRQTVASSASVIVHPADVYVGVEEPETGFHELPATIRPRVVVTSPDGTKHAGREVRLQLVQRRWTLARLTHGASSRSEMRVIDDVVATCTVRSAREPQTCGLPAPAAGYYVVLASTSDTKGRVARAAVDTYVLGAGQSYWRDDDSGRLELVADKAQYRPGDTARVLVKSPFPEARALVTVEADGVFEQRHVELKGATPTITVPIDERLRPNAYLSVHLVRPRGAAPSEPGKPDLGAPTFRMGHLELRVDAEARRLRVAVSPSAKELRPGEELEVDVEVKDADGKPARSEVTLYAADEGVLSLIGYRTPDPLPVFTAPRPLRTATLESRQSLGRVLTDVTGLLGLGPDKGAEGGGGGEGGSRARRDFRQSVYFNPTLQTGADGRARVKFRLPESLTTYRLMAVVTTTDDRYGYAEDRVVTNKKLMARPALPRLLRAGDHAEAGVVVSGKDFGPARVRVRLEASGVEPLGALERAIDLPQDGSTEVRFPIKAPRVGTAQLRFVVSGGGERDSVEVERRIASPATLEAVSLYGQTTSAAAEALGDLSSIRRDTGGLEVKVASTALVGVDAGFQQLLEYPYGCTEQLASKLLPLLPLRSLAKSFGTPLPKDVDQVITKTVADILSRQLGDGGFAMWPESAGSSPWVSAYATWALHEAAQRGVAIPARAMKRAQEYLRGQLEAERDPLWLASAPFWVDVLAALGSPDPGYMNQLFERRGELPVFSRAMLLHAMARSKQPARDVTLLARELEANVRLEANRAVAVDNVGNRYAVLMDSPERTTALVLRALLASRADHPLGARLARGLLAARQGGSWRSTQETAFALLALDDYRSAQEKTRANFVARLWFGEDKLSEFSFSEPSKPAFAQQSLIPAAQLRSGNVVFEKEGAGTLFYEARLRYARATLPSTSLDRGFFVQKTLRAVTPAELDKALGTIPSEGTSQVPAGGLVLTDLLLVASGPREYVVLDDPLPAGLEAVDARLSTSARWANISGSAADDEPPSEDAIAHGRALLPSHYRRELRDDRALFFVDHLPAGVYHYRYLARATTPGVFVVPPSRAEEMYNPEVFGRTAASVLEVK